MTYALQLDTRRFLADDWQQRPRLIRQAFPGFEPPLDTNDLAGLACEDGVDARLVSGSYPGNDWALEYGPFSEERLTGLPTRDWTLLVQDVEKHYPPLRELMLAFSFLPSWRLDDLMVSVAAAGGSVGPHADQYDVFLLQAAGRRRWQIARHFDPALLEDCELNVLQQFEPEQEWVLEPGDMLYLPPGVAHHGVALDTGMTWSIGLRAPSSADLLQALGEWLAQNHQEGNRYRDPAFPASGSSTVPDPGEIAQQALESLQGLMANAVSDAGELSPFLGSFLSRFRLAQVPAPPPSNISLEELELALRSGRPIRANPWTRLVWHRQGNHALLWAAGSGFECRIEDAQRACDDRALSELKLRPGQRLDDPLANLLCELLNEGHLYLEQL